MNKNIELRKRIVTTLIMAVVIAGLLLTAHVLVNYFDLSGFLQRIHGG